MKVSVQYPVSLFRRCCRGGHRGRFGGQFLFNFGPFLLVWMLLFFFDNAVLLRLEKGGGANTRYPIAVIFSSYRRAAAVTRLVKSHTIASSNRCTSTATSQVLLAAVGYRSIGGEAMQRRRPVDRRDFMRRIDRPPSKSLSWSLLLLLLRSLLLL